MPFLLAIPLMVRTLSGGQTRSQLWRHNPNCHLIATLAQSGSSLLLHTQRLREARNGRNHAPATNFHFNFQWLTSLLDLDLPGSCRRVHDRIQRLARTNKANSGMRMTPALFSANQQQLSFE
jgi:hypothetical protein